MPLLVECVECGRNCNPFHALEKWILQNTSYETIEEIPLEALTGLLEEFSEEMGKRNEDKTYGHVASDFFFESQVFNF